MTAVERLSYGPHPDQWIDVGRPSGTARGTAALVHGGFWRAAYDASLMLPLASDLLRRGWVAANVEYRRPGRETEAGWPAVLADVAGAFDALGMLASAQPLVAIGHSAGGQLALWAAARAGLPDGAPGAVPRVVPGHVVAQAGVLDLEAAADERLGRDAARLLLGGGPDRVADRYALASPIRRLPLGADQLIVHGVDDPHVPCEMSRRYAEAARRAGDSVTLVELDGVGHFEHLDPGHRAWGSVVSYLDAIAAEPVS